METQRNSNISPHIGLKIRNVQPTDIKRLHDIEIRSFKTPFSYKMLEHLSKTKNVIYLVGEIEKKIVGYSIVSLHDAEAHLISIVIDGNYRRKGLGTQLLQKNIEKIKENNIKKLLLEVRVSNEPAREFYSKFRFKPVRTKVNYYSDNEDALEMELNL
ncbi:MAG: ribosomal protein S18-alanine N-acetyltransferase [Candidatus Helarchaeota archaeon]